MEILTARIYVVFAKQVLPETNRHQFQIFPFAFRHTHTHAQAHRHWSQNVFLTHADRMFPCMFHEPHTRTHTVTHTQTRFARVRNTDREKEER